MPTTITTALKQSATLFVDDEAVSIPILIEILDDSGTDTSSYKYLKVLFFNHLKSDSICVRHLQKEKISHSLEYLKETNVDYVQGLHLHSPSYLSGLVQHASLSQSPYKSIYAI